MKLTPKEVNECIWKTYGIPACLTCRKPITEFKYDRHNDKYLDVKYCPHYCDERCERLMILK